MEAGALRHRITIQLKAEIVDPSTGYRTHDWVDRITDLPAQWLPGPGREYLAAEAIRAEVSGRFICRWSPITAGIDASDRVLWDGRIMAIKAPPLPDDSARRTVTLMVGEGPGDGS